MINKQKYIKEIQEIRNTLKGVIHYTPLERSHTFSQFTNNDTFLKLENFQRTGAFKIRGAYNKISKLSESEQKKGVITASAGNHGQAVALAAKMFDIKSLIIVPENSPIVKIEAIKNYNDKGEIIEYGLTYDDAYQKARELEKSRGFTFVPAFDDMDIIKGQATIGVEILDQLPEVDYIICPVGGGGLISGIGSYCKEKKPDIKIIGVQSENAPFMYKAYKGRKIPAASIKDTICDGIAVKRPGTLTLKMIKTYIDDIVLVSDEEVANAILLLLERAKTYVEGAGAAGLAALLSQKVRITGKKVVVIISGGNLTPNLLNRIIKKGLIKAGRLLKLKTKVPDVPGALLNVLRIIADAKGNIITIIHEREKLELEYKKAEVILEIETRNQHHIHEILQTLKEHFSIEVLKF
ncbi:MAG: L-threonine ammonia-lyase [Promethearchaeota archaeon]|nr:MAG: L-threonine ammonia-lyase [Candidatus Lokiarchaeota archaeon]